MPAAIGVALALAVGSADVCRAATPGDPFEKFNRKNFELEERFNRYTIGPLTHLYRALTPGVIGRVIHNIIFNLKEPEAFVNDLFQLRPKRAGSTAARFVLNSTVGLGGMIDVAVKAGLPYHASSFGDTLGRYGVHPGPYLFLPMVGPSTVRDLAGNIVDDVLNPLHFVVYPHRQTISLSLALVGGLDQFRYSESDLRTLLSNAADPYATLRSTFLQNREAEISGQTEVPATLPNLDDPTTATPPSAQLDTDHVIPATDQASTLMNLPGGEHGQADAKVPGPLDQRQGDRRLGAQAENGSQDCIADLLYAQAHWRNEGGRAQRADQGFQTNDVGKTNMDPSDPQGQPHARSAEGPGRQMEQDRQQNAACPAMQIAEQTAGFDGVGGGGR
jgi:phospholipid-binding lipoprotein MlaA